MFVEKCLRGLFIVKLSRSSSNLNISDIDLIASGVLSCS